MQTNYNEVAVLQQGAGKVTGARKLVKKVNIPMRDIEMSGKMKRLKRKMEVQKITFNYFAWPQPRNWNFFMQWWWWPYKKYCCLVSKFVVDVWDGLDESEISRPEILFQSAPVCMLPEPTHKNVTWLSLYICRTVWLTVPFTQQVFIKYRVMNVTNVSLIIERGCQFP